MVSIEQNKNSESLNNNSVSTANHGLNKEDRKLSKQIKRRYWMICVGIMLLYSGYNCYLALQSSIHVENGLGSKLTTITYVTQMVISLLFAPFILRLIGPKKAFILAECAYILYVLVNTFSNEVLLVIGAIAASIAEALFWVPIGIMMVYFSKKYHKASAIPESICYMEFSGILYGSYEFNQVVGNAVATLVLNVVNVHVEANDTISNVTADIATSTIPSYQNFTTTNSAGNVSSSGQREYMFCGANDCQDVEIVNEVIDNYVPTNPITTYVLTGCLMVLMLLGMISHIILIPEMPFSFFNETSDLEDHNNFDDKSNKNSFKKVLLLSYNATKDTFMHLINPYQFFIVTPYTLYTGINLGFVLSEATRAYAACILGVNMVGICVIIFAFTATINSMLIGKVFGKRGRLPLLIFQVIFDLLIYIFCLFWEPTESTTWLVYVLFAALGIYNSTSGMIVASIYGSDFYKHKELSFNLWCIVFAAGIAIQYGISTLLCVREKIYIFMAWIIVFATLQGVFEVYTSKKTKKLEKEEEEEAQMI